MGLNIFSFDLTELINSFSDFGWFSNENECAEKFSAPETALDSVEETPPRAAIDSITDKILSAAIANATASSVKSDEILKTAVNIKNPPSNRAHNHAHTEEQKTIEELIELLQTTVIHSYKSSDIAGENVSLNTVAAFFKKKYQTDFESNQTKLSEDQKREQAKLERMRDELKKAILKNNASV